MIGNKALSSVAGSPALEQIKAALSSRTGTAPREAQPSTEIDTAAVSKLGQALKGMAAEAFQYLDNETKGKLEKAVNDGKISAEDAVAGLRFMARDSLFHRYLREAPKTEEQVKASKDMEVVRQLRGERRAEMNSVSEKMGNIQKAFDSGQISEADYREQFDAAAKEMRSAGREKYAKLPDGRDVGEITEQAIKVSFTTSAKGFSALDFGEDDSPEGAAGTQKELDALAKLGDIGLNTHKIRRDSLSRFAAEYDIPGFGRAAPKSLPSDNPAATPTVAPTAASATQASAATAQASAGDKEDGLVVLAMLQSALNRDAASGKKPASILETLDQVLTGTGPGAAKRI